jgi:hypothetical protein
MTISPTSCPSLTCPPAFGTPRDPSRATLGGRVADAAARLGKPFMPWQRHVADVVMRSTRRRGGWPTRRWA